MAKRSAKKIKGHPWSHASGMSYELPDGSGVNIWACGVRRISRWTWFWADFEREKLPKVWYQVVPQGKEPDDEWELMKPAEEALEERGETIDEEGGARLGASRDLKRGRYRFEVMFKIGTQEYELNDYTFSVT